MRLSNSRFSVPRASGRSLLLFFSYLRELIKNVLSHDLILSRYKDFSECFPLWCEEQPSGAEGVFNTVSNFIETHIVVRAFPFPFPQPPNSAHTFASLRVKKKKQEQHKQTVRGIRRPEKLGHAASSGDRSTGTPTTQ